MRPISLSAFLLLLGASVFAALEVQPGNGVTEENLLASPVVNRGPSSPSVDSAFQTAILGSHAPGGEIIMKGCTEPSEREIRFRGESLREVLDDIVRADSDYEWMVNDGVVNLVPVEGVPDLLTLRIAAFDSADATSPGTATTYLFALPEVRERTVELGFSQGATGTGPYSVSRGSPPVRKPLKVHVEAVTLFDALNAIVRANRHGLWRYQETHCKSENFFSIDFTD